MDEALVRNAEIGGGALADVVLARDIEAEFGLWLPIKAYERSWRPDDLADFLERRSRNRVRNRADVERERSKARGQVRGAVFWGIAGPAFTAWTLSFAQDAVALAGFLVLCGPFLAVSFFCLRSLPHHIQEQAHYARIAGRIADEA